MKSKKYDQLENYVPAQDWDRETPYRGDTLPGTWAFVVVGVMIGILAAVLLGALAILVGDNVGWSTRTTLLVMLLAWATALLSAFPSLIKRFFDV